MVELLLLLLLLLSLYCYLCVRVHEHAAVCVLLLSRCHHSHYCYVLTTFKYVFIVVCVGKSVLCCFSKDTNMNDSSLLYFYYYYFLYSKCAVNSIVVITNQVTQFVVCDFIVVAFIIFPLVFSYFCDHIFSYLWQYHSNILCCFEFISRISFCYVVCFSAFVAKEEKKK